MIFFNNKGGGMKKKILCGILLLTISILGCTITLPEVRFHPIYTEVHRYTHHYSTKEYFYPFSAPTLYCSTPPLHTHNWHYHGGCGHEHPHSRNHLHDIWHYKNYHYYP